MSGDTSEDIAAIIQSVEEYSSLQGGAAQFACTELIELPLVKLPLIVAKGSTNQSTDQSSHQSETRTTLSYPLPISQCVELISIASQAPFGKGEQTLIDRAVRNTWQINADKISIDDVTLSMINRTILPRVCKQLGLAGETDKVEAHLYKLLIYETGGHFSPHRDSEKDDGMFGTLVLLLPSEYSGGQLCIEHNGKSLVVDWAKDMHWRSFAYAAFYADCRHEIKPVTSGYRVALTFNLCMKRANISGTQQVINKNRVDDPIVMSDSDISTTSNKNENNGTDKKIEDGLQLPSATLNSQYPPIVRRLAKVFEEWQDYTEIVIAFEHQYTKDSLSRDSLKGTDKALMALVENAINLLRNKNKSQDDVCPQIIPLLCHVECIQSGQLECEEEMEPTSNSVYDIVPYTLTPPPRCLDLFYSLVQKCKISGSFILHTDPKFDWCNEYYDDENIEPTGNEGQCIT